MTLWTPADDAGTYVWHKAKSSSGYHLTSSQVDTLYDLTTNGRNSTSSGGPTIGTIDGTLAAMVFGGSSGSQLTTAVPCRMARVAYFAFVNLSSGYHSVFGCNDSSHGYSVGVDSGHVFMDVIGETNIFSTGTFTYSTPQLFCVWHDDSTGDWELRINGTSVATGNYNAPSAGLGIGNHYISGVSGRDYMNGKGGEFVVATTFDTAYLEKVEGSILWDWGYQALLPGGHTYAGAAPTNGSATTLSPGSGSLTITGQSPSLTTYISPGTGSLAITGQQALLGGIVSITPGTGALTLTGQSPALKAILSPGAGALSITGQLASLTPSVNNDLFPGSGTLTINGQPPIISGIRYLKSSRVRMRNIA